MHRASYWKTTAAAFAGAALSVLALFVLRFVATPTWLAPGARVLASLACVAGALAGVGGLICLWRDSREGSGKPDPLAAHVNRIPVPGLLSRLGLRFLLGSKLRPGDLVQVRSRSEIETTLDPADTLEGLPFMAEMEAYCGGIFRVHRRVDKINDMRHKTGRRRIHDTVSLGEVRCTGSHHGGCDAECQILWKERWLRKVPGKHPAAATRISARASEAAIDEAAAANGQEYVCQMTQLWEASHPMSPFDLRQDLRPLLLGNIGIREYAIAVFTQIFNIVQRLRGGIPYPYIPESASTGQTPTSSLNLQPGDEVIVRSKSEISQTLVGSRNRGLWFDPEMVRYCGQRAVVRKRVRRIIHEGTKKMVSMKSPCVVLETGIATGEYLRLCPQHDYIFWREIWLERPNASRVPTSDPGRVPS